MKKKLLLSIVIVTVLSVMSIFAYVQDYSSTGWTTNNGLNTMRGQARDLTTIPGGYSFRCVGSGTCYSISGGTLEIFDGPGSEPGGDPLDVWKN